METTSLIPVLGILALAVAVVVLLLHFMRRARHPAPARRPEVAKAVTSDKESSETLSNEEREYLDSSHIGGPILPSGQNGLDTRVDAWRNNKRK